MSQVIRISVKTSERLEKYAKAFESRSDVIERLLDSYEAALKAAGKMPKYHLNKPGEERDET